MQHSAGKDYCWLECKAEHCFLCSLLAQYLSSKLSYPTTSRNLHLRHPSKLQISQLLSWKMLCGRAFAQFYMQSELQARCSGKSRMCVHLRLLSAQLPEPFPRTLTLSTCWIAEPKQACVSEVFTLCQVR